jgi:glycosyltransferase involved in cell wall biosynthesis
METSSLMGKIKTGRVNVFFCNSNYTKSFIDNKFHIKTTVLFPPVKIKSMNINKENIILHVGRFRIKNVKNDDYKKQWVMIAEFKKMIDKGLKNWKFVLAVSINSKDKNEFLEMKNFAKNYPIEFLVNRSNDDLWEIYSKAKIYWHASGYGEDLKLHPEYAEHFGMSTVEAMGAGAVPVVINAGGQREIVTEGENGYLWDTLEELHSKTLNLTKNENEILRISKNAKNRAMDFSEERFSERAKELIND